MTGAQKKKNDGYEMTDAQKTDAYEMTDAQKSHEYEMTGAQKIDAYKMTGAQKKKIDAYKMKGAQKIDEYELTDARKIDAYKLMTGAQKKKNDGYEMTDAQKNDAYEMTDAQKIDAYEMTGAQKIDAYEMTGAQKKKIDAYKLTDAQKQKTDVYELMDSQKKIDAYKLTDAQKQKTDVYELMDSQKKIDAYKMKGAQKSHEYEMTDAQKKKADEYELMDSQKKIDAYKMTGAQKSHEYELTDAQKKKADVYKLMDSQKTHEYKMTGAQKIDAYKMTGAQKNHEYEMTGAQKKIDAYKMKGSQKIREYELTGARKSHEYEMTGAQKKIDAYRLMDSQKTREYELTGAQKKIDAYRLMDSQKTREYNLTGAQKTDENSSCVKVRKNDGVEIIHECQRKRDVDVKPVVQDPMDDERVPVESGTEMTPVPREPSEFEKQKHNLTHIPFQPWCTSCVKGKAQADPHKRTERIIEDSELPVIQCDYLMLKDTAGTGGLKVLSMYVRTFGYGMSTVVETKGPTDSYATTWAVKMLNFLGLSDIILQCDPEPSLIKWAESVKSKRTERTVIRSSPRRSHQSNGGVENYQKQLQGQVRTMLAAMQEHTKYRPSADNALMRWIVRHAAWLIPRFRGSEIQSPFYRAMGGPYRGKLVEFGETVLAHLPEVGKGSGNPAPKLADRWKSGVWLGKSDLTDEHLVRTDDGVVYARSVRRLAENSWSEENLKAVVETPQKPRSMTTDDALDPRVVPEAHEQENPNEEANENNEESGETPDKPEDMDHEMEGETLPEPDTAATSSSSRGEKRTETQENVFVKRRLMAKSPKRPITLVPPPEDPVKRRLLKKQTDTRNDELVMNVDENLLNVVSKLTKDENMPEVNSDEDKEMPKFTVLDDYEEMMKGRQKELNSLKEMGTMTVVKRTEAVGKRTIQTRWVDREKDGKVKSRLVLKDYNRCQGRTQPEMFSPTPSTLSLKTMLAASSHDRNNDPESNHITISIDVHTAFLHADVDQDLFAEPPEPDEWYDAGLKEDEVWKLNKALYGYRKAPKLWHKHLVNVLESLNYHPLLTDPSCFRNDETNTNIFVHVDDGLMFGPKSEVLKLVELLSKQVLMRITGRMEKTGDKIYFLGRVIERTARGYSVEANPKYIQNVMNVLGLEEAKPVMTPSVKRTPTTESLVELEGERRAMYRTVVGKLLYMCQERADIMYSVKETARKITCPTESDEMNLKRIVRYLKGAPSAKSLIEITTPSKFVNVYTDSDWAGQATTCKSTSGGVVQWGNATLTAWSRTQQTVSLSSAEAELYALTTGVAEGMVTKHLLQELGHEVILMNHVDSQSAKAWASKRGLGRMKHVMLKYMYVQDVVEKKLTNLAYISTKQNKADLMTKCHTSEAHKRGCAMIGLRLA